MRGSVTGSDTPSILERDLRGTFLNTGAAERPARSQTNDLLSDWAMQPTAALNAMEARGLLPTDAEVAALPSPDEE
jgi:hypothetical protein